MYYGSQRGDKGIRGDKGRFHKMLYTFCIFQFQFHFQSVYKMNLVAKHADQSANYKIANLRSKKFDVNSLN